MEAEWDRIKISGLEQNNFTAPHDWSEHFIFNTLNVLQYYILIQDSERAVTHLGHFSKLLRGMMYVPDRIRLHEELELLDHYLALEAVRFESFKYKIDVVTELSLLTTEVPSRITQPFTERVLSRNKTAMDISLHVKIRDTKFYVYIDFECEPDSRTNTLVLPKLTDVPRVQTPVRQIDFK